jgi:lipopolysaccharide/colanic/teichoic acid biosynthesis glycosyltransferase
MSLGPMAGNPPVVLSHEPADGDYRHWIHAAAPAARVVDEVEEFADAFPRAELSDAFLIVDPRCLPVGDSQISDLIRAHAAEPRVAHHLIAFDAPVAGTKERLNFDATGQIRGIHRHYEDATWPFLAGVAATVLPGAAGILTAGLATRSLAGLRSALTARGVPGRDIPVKGGSIDLRTEHGLLAANELFVLQAADTQAGPRSSKPIYIGSEHRIHARARLIGPIVIHSHVEIEENATVLGPAVIGAGARIAAGAVAAHVTVGPDCVVQRGQVVRDQAWFQIANEESSAGQCGRLSYGERLARLSFLAAESSQLEDEAVPTLHRHLFLKRALDVTVAAVALLLLLPVLAIIATAVWLESRGPIFFGDQREGMSGRAFGCWKFRTMFTGAHLAQIQLNGLNQTDGPHFKVERDPRVTKVGRVLRALNVDELPQLFNVLIGQMSLVGPRPSPFRENQVCVPWREARLSVRPGITGFWQVCRHHRSAGDFHQWIEYDLLYVQHLSLWLDLKILAATVLTLGGKGGHIPDSWLISGLADRVAAEFEDSRETQAA